MPPHGVARDIREVAEEVLVDGDAARFDARVDRWEGPEDPGPNGDQPYVARQLGFEERSWRPLGMQDLDEVLAGTVRVMRGAEGQTDYVMRDHHVLDAVLYHYRTTGTLPAGLFHADRHSDWCRDGYLATHRPAQAATWWTLLEGLKRPDGSAVLGEGQVTFTTAAPAETLAGRDVGASSRVPWWVEQAELAWPQALARAGAPDWVSVDLDYLQPIEQLVLTRGLLRDARFHGLMRRARVRLFVLSPQFTCGGDVLTDWTVRGRHASLRMLDLVRGMRMRTEPESTIGLSFPAQHGHRGGSSGGCR